MNKVNASQDITTGHAKSRGRTKGTGCLIKRGNVFYAVWVVNGRVYKRSTKKTDRQEALAVLAEFTAPYRLKNEVETVRALAARAERKEGELPALLIADLWSEVEKNRPHWESATLRMNRTRVLAFVDWMAKRHPEVSEVRKVTAKMGEEFLSFLENQNKVSSKTRIDYRAILLQSFNLTREQSRIVENIWNKTRRPIRNSERKETLTRDQVTEIFASLQAGSMDKSAINPWEWRCLFALGIYTGMRLGDCCLFRWESMDARLGILKAKPHKTKRFGTTVELGIHPALKSILEQSTGERKGYVLPTIAEKYKRNSAGISKKIMKVLKRAGIEIPRQNEDGRRNTSLVGFHSLRVFFITESLASGVPLPTIQAIVGHLSPSMTQHYYRLNPAQLEIVRNALPDFTVPKEENPLDCKLKALAEVVRGWATDDLVAGIKELQRILAQQGCKAAIL